jgi:hypothetical protein
MEDASLWQKVEDQRRLDDTAAWEKAEERRRLDDIAAWEKAEGQRRVEAGQKRQESERSLWQDEERRRHEDGLAWSRAEELRRQAEAETWAREEKVRRQAEMEAWSRAEELRRRCETEAWARREEDRQRLAAEDRARQEQRRALLRQKRFSPCVISAGPALRFSVTPGKVQIFVNEKEITRREGLRTLFAVSGTEISSSFGAEWRVRQHSSTEIVCFLKWRKPMGFFQAWKFTLLPEGGVGVEVWMRNRVGVIVENERFECCLSVPVNIFEQASLGARSKVFRSEAEDFYLETLSEQQVSGLALPEEGVFQPYFLTTQEFAEQQQRQGKVRAYFKGRFCLATALAPAVISMPLVHETTSEKLKVSFKEGFMSIFHNGHRLTTGAGLYASLFSRGVWHDSGQAVWRLESVAEDGFVVCGAWPWIPVVQRWEIRLKDGKTISWDCRMRVICSTQISIEEAVLMLDSAYTQWSEGDGVKVFPEGFTSVDQFRVCLNAIDANGKTRVSARSSVLPEMVFAPGELKEHKIMVENAGHMDGALARMFHCLRVYKGKDSFVQPGEYGFFRGDIMVNTGEVS